MTRYVIFTIDPLCVGSASGVNTAIHNIVANKLFANISFTGVKIKFSVTFDVSEVTLRSISVSFQQSTSIFVNQNFSSHVSYVVLSKYFYIDTSDTV